MANGRHKDFLNAGILGGGAGVPTKRGFRPISTEYIGSPAYDAEFFETFPTAWASAYAFTKALEAEPSPADNGQTARSAEAAEGQVAAVTEEWITLFLLHYFGIVHLSDYGRDALERDYDKDLWLALSGTYPSSRGGGLDSIKLLETNEHTVVGAYYPEIVFFPARGRGGWQADRGLAAYLVGARLSWELASRQLLTSEQKQREFHEHLTRVSELLPSQTFKNKVQRFCARNFAGQPHPSGPPLGPNPAQWDIPGNTPPKPQDFLDHYPLQRPSGRGGRIYYLVSGMLHITPWMTTAVIAGCSPYQYRQTGPYQITVHALGRDIKCDLEDGKDEIVPLKDLFLSDPPYWCKVNRAATAYTSKLKTLHKVELRDPVLKQDEVAICLAPVRRKFLEHFPELFKSRVVPTPDVQRPAVEWSFPVPGKSGETYEVRWPTTPIGQREMPNTSVALWPPKVSRDWKLYAAYATGSKEACGRWHLVSEKGAQGELVSVEEEEYISILQPLGAGSNTPKGLLFTDNNDNERGVLFLADLDERQAAADAGKVTLSVDFGTSNTCLAYKNDAEGKPATLKFGLSPAMLWGDAPAVEIPGFVPFRWGGGNKGFFPTILLSRKTAGRLDEIKPGEIGINHLFKVDILGLHAGMEDRWLDGRLDSLWESHLRIKWDLDIKTPWRSLFLGLTLLYAHAELFFGRAQGAKITNYILTFPLAFTDTDRREFHAEAKKIIQKIRYFCYGATPQPDSFDFQYSDQIDESTAIARAARVGGVSNAMEVFIDVGGGTADIAVRNGNDFLVLDSLKLAGNTFFRIAERNFEEPMVGSDAFKKHLARVLFGAPDFFNSRRPRGDLGTYYSVAINAVPEDEFHKREAKVIQEGMGTNSYQRYRSRLLFRHALAYSLLQACAAVVGNRIELDQGIKLILGGNGWGLLMFAELPRQKRALEAEAAEILRLLKEKLREVVAEDEWPFIERLSVAGVELLNEVNLSRAKTDVAVGAINASEDRRAHRAGDKDATTPFTGLTVKGLSVNEREARVVRWCDRWGFEEFREKFGFMDAIKSVRFEQPRDLRQPFDPVLSVFTRLGNVGRTDVDNMPGETWRDINAEICEELSLLEGSRLERPPINHFISRVLYPEDQQRDFLDTLAEENGSYKSDSR